MHANCLLQAPTHQASRGRAGLEADHHGGLGADYGVPDQFLNSGELHLLLTSLHGEENKEVAAPRTASLPCSASPLPALLPYLPGLQLGKHRQAEIGAVSEGPGYKQPLIRDLLQADFQLGTRDKGIGLTGPNYYSYFSQLPRTLRSKFHPRETDRERLRQRDHPLPNSASYIPIHLC